MGAGATRVIGGYELHELIGGGGMGQVWLASRLGIAGVRKMIALKLVSALARSEQARRRFLDEARVSLLLAHSNLVQVFEVGMEDDLGFIAMEWVEGIDLARILAALREEGRACPPTMAAFIVGEILRGLEYAHALTHGGRALDLVHRDISPHNVLVSTNGEIKITDFGIARSALAEATDLEFAGKWRYMAPEQLRHQAVGAAADLYAVGVILHELLAGQPFRSDLQSAMRLELPPLPDDTPPVLAELRRRLLEVDPSARMRRARDGIGMIEDWEGYRRASHALATIVRDLRPALLVRSAAHSAADADATEAATRTGTETAPTRTSIAPRALRRWTIAAVGVTLAAGTVAGGIALHRSLHPLVWRGGCPVDADGDGDLDVAGFLARTREPGASIELVVMDGASGREQVHLDGRTEIEGLKCWSSAAMFVTRRDAAPEVWGNGDWTGPWVASATDGPGTLVGGFGFVPRVPADWQPWSSAWPSSPWSGIGWGSVGVEIRDDATTWSASRDASGGLLVAARGRIEWQRRLALGPTAPTLQRSGDEILTVSTNVIDGGEAAALLVLDASTGETLRELPLGEVRSSTFFVVDDGVLLTDIGDGLVALDVATGERRWSR
ncbi:MAG TPA: serine/threonine-protein kinase [Nannocystaceae bacterium]|nr:serine/threonine-protein kinase [Nannocystaceae bacterium]